jgi:hypothetical protein
MDMLTAVQYLSMLRTSFKMFGSKLTLENSSAFFNNVIAARSSLIKSCGGLGIALIVSYSVDTVSLAAEATAMRGS